MRKKKIALITIGVIFVILSLVVWWQFENIKSVYFYFKYSGDDINTMIEESNKEVEEYLKSNPEYSVRPSTDVEEKLHQAGVISDDELVAVITGQTDVEEMIGVNVVLNESNKFVNEQSGEVLSKEKLIEMKNEVSLQKQNQNLANSPGSEGSSKNEKGNGNTSEKASGASDSGKNADGDKAANKSPAEKGTDPKNPTDSGKKENEKPAENVNGESKPEANKGNDKVTNESGDTSQNISGDMASQYIAQMYVLKSSFSGQVNALYQEAVAAYKALPESERNEAGKAAVIKQIVSKASALEASCDGQVAAILGELESALISSGQSTDVVTKMRNAYYQEKSLVKAQYMNEL